jgi:hypothetical protein
MPEQLYWNRGGEKDFAEMARRRQLVGDVEFHDEPQDTECDAWRTLLDLVEKAAEDGRSWLPHRRWRSRTFAPLKNMNPVDRDQIVTLPPTIAKLKSVRRLDLYRSYLVRIPPEIGEMTSLTDFDPYTSHRLHWFPYEITRCRKLRHSRVSTRALYGNFKYRPPFPRLETQTCTGGEASSRCSVCDRPFEDMGLHRVWISLGVGTDVLPLLVNACSDECVRRLPRPVEGYVQEPHRGGLEVRQPPPAIVGP